MKIYFNNAASSYPKPDCVIEAVTDSIKNQFGEAGRGIPGNDPREEGRHRAAKLFGLSDACRVIFVPSATYALNAVILSIMNPPVGHVVTTALEHNSVLRPLERLRRDSKVALTHIDPEADGCLDPAKVAAAIRTDTKLIAVTHISNVTGCVQPVEDIADIAAKRGLPLLLDASQSAGLVPLDLSRLPGRVFVAVAGHKGLQGPSGTGLLLLPDNELEPVLAGGTGIDSEAPIMPQRLPVRWEPGTPNMSGIAGLAAGMKFVLEKGVDVLGVLRNDLTVYLRNKLSELPGLNLSPWVHEDGRAGIVSFTLQGWTASELGYVLSHSFDIETRAGLHCAPRAHYAMGTFPNGSLRVSLGLFSTRDEVEALLLALRTLVAP